jgi:integrase
MSLNHSAIFSGVVGISGPGRATRPFAQTAPQKRGRERWVRIELALVVAEATGARIGAIRGLRWSDITSSPPRIRWRAEFDKKGRERLVPMPESLVQELRRFQAKLGGIGDGWMFPCADGSEPWPREIFGEQFRVAEQKAGLEHLEGGAWHPYRRKWATERKDLPLVDVKATGGWRDTNTLLTCYQQTDEASMLRVMEAPRKLRGTG